MANLKTSKSTAVETAAEALIEAHAAKKQYDSARDEFFRLLNQIVKDEGEVPETAFETELGVTDEQVLREFPDYEIVNKEESDNGIAWLLVKDASLIPREIVVRSLGQVVGRSVSSGRDQLDLDELLEEHPEYGELVTETYTVDGDVVQEILAEVPELADHFKLVNRVLTEAVINDYSEDHPEILMHIEDHKYPKRSTVRITTPRKAKPEELEE